MSEQAIYFCRTEGFTERYGIPKWPDSPPRPVTWHTIGGVSSTVNAAAFQATFKYALESLMQVCGLTLEYSANRKTANIVAYAAPIGTPGFGKPQGVLADSELPVNLRSNDDEQMDQRYDSENWSSEDFVTVPGKISLPTVIRHEVCHALGLDHGGSDLMAPQLNPKLAFPGEWTTRELVKRYGERSGGPVPIPPVNGDVVEVRYQNGKAVVKVNGVLYRPSPFAGN
jgi:hypothetical protein